MRSPVGEGRSFRSRAMGAENTIPALAIRAGGADAAQEAGLTATAPIDAELVVRAARRIRRALLEHAFRLGPARIGAEETGRLISLLTDSVERVVEYRQAYIGELIGAVATPFLVLVVVGALIDPVAALVLVACIPFVPLSIALFQRFVRDDSSASREMRARLSAQFLEAIQGLSTLVGIGAADRVGERLARTGEDNRLAVMRVLARNQLILFVMEGVFSLFLVTAAIVVSWIRPPR